MTSSHLQQMETQTPPLEMLETSRDMIETRNFQTGTEGGRVETAAYDNQDGTMMNEQKRTSYDMVSGSASEEEVPAEGFDTRGSRMHHNKNNP